MKNDESRKKEKKQTWTNANKIDKQERKRERKKLNSRLQMLSRIRSIRRRKMMDPKLEWKSVDSKTSWKERMIENEETDADADADTDTNVLEELATESSYSTIGRFAAP